MNTYDENIQQAERMVKELEQAQALSMEEYKKRSNEVKRLLDACEKQLKTLENDLLV